MPRSVSARCIRLMMSPRSPSSRSVASAFVAIAHWPGPTWFGEAEGLQLAQPPDLQA
jgi:hypothetical protein